MAQVRVVGGGLAGCEAAWQLAQCGHQVSLWEMKPARRTPAQVTDRLCELVCSNSLRSANIENAVGLLKEEMRQAGSLIIAAAHAARVPAGDALAVNRELFSSFVEDALAGHTGIDVCSREMTALPTDGVPTVVATGPLTTPELAADIAKICGAEHLAFYDAIAPIVDADSVDLEHAFSASRWGRGNPEDYLNCALSQAEYHAFVEALVAAEQYKLHAFEEPRYFEGCLPVEVMAHRGPMTLAFGPMKPVGLEDPRTGLRPHAVVQLRRENKAGTAYNLVGFQTRMTQPAQRAVFGLVPALKNARYQRYGAVHRNTYVNSPAVLDDRLALPGFAHVRLAGQVTGVEGYVESAAIGLLVGRMLGVELGGGVALPPPPETALGALYGHTRGWERASATARYDPTNVTWALFPALPGRHKKDARKKAYVQRAAQALPAWLAAVGVAPPVAAETA